MLVSLTVFEILLTFKSRAFYTIQKNVQKCRILYFYDKAIKSRSNQSSKYQIQKEFERHFY